MSNSSTLKIQGLKFGSLLPGLFGSLFILLLVKAIQNQAFPGFSTIELSMLFLILHVIFLTIIFFGLCPLRYATLFIGAYFFRLAILLTDRLTELEIPFLEREGDASSYFQSAATVSADLSQAGDTYGGTYAVILGYIFHLIGADRLLGQYINMVLGVATVIVLARCFRLMKIDEKVSFFTLSLAAFMPIVAINSSVLLRESIIMLLIAFALLAFLKGILESNFLWTLLSLLCVLGASTFHSGSIGVLIGFAVVSAFTYRRNEKLTFGLKRLAPALLLGFSTVGVAIQFPELFLGKFSALESPDDILDKGQSKLGGSAYLTGLEIESWASFFIYAPVRAFYFITSPLPWDWRGLGDLLTFGVDSVIYLSPFVLVFFIRVKDPNKRYLIIALLAVLCFTALIFGAGVSNTGTAIRHRAKLLVIFLALIALFLDSARSRFQKSTSTQSV